MWATKGIVPILQCFSHKVFPKLLKKVALAPTLNPHQEMIKHFQNYPPLPTRHLSQITNSNISLLQCTSYAHEKWWNKSLPNISQISPDTVYSTPTPRPRLPSPSPHKHRTFLTSVSFLHSGHLTNQFSPLCSTNLPKHCPQNVCKQLNTRGLLNVSEQIEHSKCFSRFSFWTEDFGILVVLCYEFPEKRGEN